MYALLLLPISSSFVPSHDCCLVYLFYFAVEKTKKKENCYFIEATPRTLALLALLHEALASLTPGTPHLGNVSRLALLGASPDTFPCP